MQVQLQNGGAGIEPVSDERPLIESLRAAIAAQTLEMRRVADALQGSRVDEKDKEIYRQHMKKADAENEWRTSLARWVVTIGMGLYGVACTALYQKSEIGLTFAKWAFGLGVLFSIMCVMSAHTRLVYLYMHLSAAIPYERRSPSGSGPAMDLRDAFEAPGLNIGRAEAACVSVALINVATLMVVVWYH